MRSLMFFCGFAVMPATSTAQAVNWMLSAPQDIHVQRGARCHGEGDQHMADVLTRQAAEAFTFEGEVHLRPRPPRQIDDRPRQGLVERGVGPPEALNALARTEGGADGAAADSQRTERAMAGTAFSQGIGSGKVFAGASSVAGQSNRPRTGGLLRDHAV